MMNRAERQNGRDLYVSSTPSSSWEKPRKSFYRFYINPAKRFKFITVLCAFKLCIAKYAHWSVQYTHATGGTTKETWLDSNTGRISISRQNISLHNLRLNFIFIGHEGLLPWVKDGQGGRILTRTSIWGRSQL